MLRLALLSSSIGLLLGSATPAPEAAFPAKLQPEPVLAGTPALLTLADPLPAARDEKPAPAGVPIETAARPVSQEAVGAAEAAASSPSGVRIVVSLPLQKAYVFEDGDLVWSAPVSTGKRGHETPVGTFPILQKKVHHRSNKYDDAPMPYMQRLTWQGVALHAGRVPGYPASHGCIRLPRSYAKKLYQLTDFGTTVTITREKPATAAAALDLA